MRKVRKVPSYTEIAELLNYPYVTSEQIAEIFPVSRNEAYRIRKKIDEEMEKNNEYVFHTKPKVVPLEKVFEYGKKFGFPSMESIRKMAKN